MTTPGPRQGDRPRRHPRRRADRRRGDELPRLPDHHGGTVGSSSVNRFFDPWTGPLSTRFAATFVLVAGMGVTLLTNRSRPAATGAAQRRPLDAGAPRCAALRLRVRVRLDLAGTILFFYGAFFIVAALLFTLRTRWLVVVGAAAALGGSRDPVVGVRASATAHGGCSPAGTPPHRTARPRACCSTRSSTAPIRCCRGWRSCAPASSSAAICPCGHELSAGCSCRRRPRSSPRHTAANHLLRRHATRHRCCSPPIRSAAASTTRCARSVVDRRVLRDLVDRRAVPRRSRVTRALAAAGRTTLSLYILHVLVFNLHRHRAGASSARPASTRRWCSPLRFWVRGDRRRRVVAAALRTSARAERVYRTFGDGPRSDREPITAQLAERVALRRVAGVVAAGEPLCAARTSRGSTTPGRCGPASAAGCGRRRRRRPRRAPR